MRSGSRIGSDYPPLPLAQATRSVNLGSGVPAVKKSGEALAIWG